MGSPYLRNFICLVSQDAQVCGKIDLYDLVLRICAFSNLMLKFFDISSKVIVNKSLEKNRANADFFSISILFHRFRRNHTGEVDAISIKTNDEANEEKQHVNFAPGKYVASLIVAKSDFLFITEC
ncbi:Hypothetical predicted protein [Octopus vulgaris]|uniref:Uncharacterized protein n=1 Tax=Octopus vulgaris TaxID=6645 RepID=A0AA36FB41_OCTVU|nr:Hypothetical predicted protein [Octopus vulgaris]